MNRRRKSLVIVAALAVLAAGVSLVAWSWRRASQTVGDPHRVVSSGGTNYVVRLLETTVGKTDRSAVVIVYAQIENPNPFELALDRRNFVLMDGGKNFHVPSTTGTQTALIKLPARGAAEREMFSFSVPDEALTGVLALQVGHYYWVPIKSDRPFKETLRAGEFRSFRRTDW